MEKKRTALFLLRIFLYSSLRKNASSLLDPQTAVSENVVFDFETLIAASHIVAICFSDPGPLTML